VIGPSIAGFVVAAWGEGVCFLIDGISYLAAIAAIFFIVLAPRAAARAAKARPARPARGTDLYDRLPAAAALLMLSAVVSLLGIPYTVLMPVFASDLLHGGPRTLGFLMGGIGVGAVIGASPARARADGGRAGQVDRARGFGFCAADRDLRPLAPRVALGVMMGFTGLSLVIVNASINTLVQTIADDDKRGAR
jgi:MFS family permease